MSLYIQEGSETAGLVAVEAMGLLTLGSAGNVG